MEKEKIICVDDGRGMIPTMTQNDRDGLDEAWSLQSRGELPEDWDLEKIVDESSISRHSLEWIRACIALSSKRPGQEGQRGMMGMGVLAYLQYGESATIYSKPDSDLDQAAYGDDPEYLGHTYKLECPAKSGIRRGNIDFPSLDFADSLKDPWGNFLDHGTRVEVFGVDWRIFRISQIELSFRGRFGADIRRGKYKMWIVDRTGEERLIPIVPTQYAGELILEQRRQVRGAPYSVALYFDPQGKNQSPMVTHEGSEKFRLTDIEDFKNEPWNFLTGTVGFPRFKNENRFWDPSKTRLLPLGAEFFHWVEDLESLEKELISRISTSRKRVHEKNLTDVTEQISEVLPQVLAEVPAFADFVPEHYKKRPSRKRKGTAQVFTIARVVTAMVFNEHNQGVANIEIVLAPYPNPEGIILAQGKTGSGGRISFGQQPTGFYRILMKLPTGVLPGDSKQAYNFRLIDSDLGYRAVFRVVTGEPEPEKKSPLPAFRVIPTDLGDPDKTFDSSKLNVGIVWINSGYPAMQEASNAGDLDKVKSLTACYTAFAVAEFAIANKTQAFQQGTILFGRIYDALRGKVRVSRRRRA